VTEPDAGSDVKGIRTFARRDGDSYVIDGTKMFITNGVYGDLYCVAAKTDSKMLGLLEKVSRHYAGFKLLAQHFYKFFRAPSPQTRKDGSAQAAGRAIKRRMPRQKFIHRLPVRFQQPTGTIANTT